MTKDTSDVVARLTEPVDWAHFVNDDHAADYQAERAEAAALISSLVAENEDLAETAAKYRVVCDDRDSWRRTAEKCKSEAVEAERLLAEARATTELLLSRIDPILDELGPGGYLLPAGAVLTNNLEAARNEARASTGGVNG